MKRPKFVEQIAMTGLGHRAGPHLPPLLLRKYRLTNIFSFILGFVILAMGVAGHLFGLAHPVLSSLRMVLGVLYLVPWLLMAAGWFNVARFLFMLLPPVLILSHVLVTGAEPATALQFVLLPCLMLPFLLYGLEEKPFLIFGTVLVVADFFLLNEAGHWVPLMPGVPADLFATPAEITVNAMLSLILFAWGFTFYQQHLTRAERSLIHERERADDLLKNILPAEIIPILKLKPEVIAENYASASILFADIVNFTPLASRLSPHQVVKLLNEVFSHFDHLMEKYGLEKIKTIGDCYMAAAGVPTPRPDHAEVLVEMALEALAWIEGREFEGFRLQMRMGISSGPLIAGVIGRKKFIYDLWGDTVNTASRMESHGRPGAVTVTEATWALVEPVFTARKTETIQVKGLGRMQLYEIGARR